MGSYPVWFGKEEHFSPALLLHWFSMAHGGLSSKLCILRTRWVGASNLFVIREAPGYKGKVQAKLRCGSVSYTRVKAIAAAVVGVKRRPRGREVGCKTRPIQTAYLEGP